jgi:quercetin dioxygenase-like cupin family protein
MKHLFSIVLIFSLFSCKTTQTLPDPLQAGWNGKKVCELLQDTKEQRILKCTFPPGIGHEKHYHNPHFGYTLKGGTFKITDTSGTKTITVPTGTTWSKSKVTQHEVLNVGESTSVYLIIEPKQ